VAAWWTAITATRAAGRRIRIRDVVQRIRAVVVLIPAAAVVRILAASRS